MKICGILLSSVTFEKNTADRCQSEGSNVPIPDSIGD